MTRRWISSRGSGSASSAACADCSSASWSRRHRTLVSPRLFRCSRSPSLGPVVPTIHASLNSGAAAALRNPSTSACVIALPSRRALHWMAISRLPAASSATQSMVMSSGELSGKTVVRSGHSSHLWTASTFQCLMAGPWVRTSVSNHPPSPLSSAWASISLSASRRASFVICRFRVALLHESSRARTMPTDRILTCRCGMTLVGRGRSSD